MSEDRPLLPEWGIHLRNLIDRVVPVVRENRDRVETLEQTVSRLEKQIAQYQSRLQRAETTVAVLDAKARGTGPTTGSD